MAICIGKNILPLWRTKLGFAPLWLCPMHLLVHSITRVDLEMFSAFYTYRAKAIKIICMSTNPVIIVYLKESSLSN
jgi:hypothetical protein